MPAIGGVTQALSRDEIEHMSFGYYEHETDEKLTQLTIKFTTLEG